MNNWIPVKQALPPEHVKVMTKIDDGKGVRNVQAMFFHHNLWWTGNTGDAMYVYYTPTHWCATDQSEKEG